MQINFLDGSVKFFNGLRNADLRYADLRYADLRYADLRGANLQDANLRHADLQHAVLQDANLQGANLWRANLQGANLQDVNLRHAVLRHTNLQDVNLQHADLQSVNLRYADLQHADLRGAKIKDVKWPSPSMLLLASWGKVSDNLTQLLMKYDMSNHPEPEKFQVWKDTGECPYFHGSIQRCANFKEVRNLFDPNVPLLSAYELIQMLLKERCVE